MWWFEKRSHLAFGQQSEELPNARYCALLAGA
jgi:hypothetical protein